MEASLRPTTGTYFNKFLGVWRHLATARHAICFNGRHRRVPVCNTEVAASTTYSNSGTGFGNGANPASCSGNNKDVQEATFGYWYNFYNGPKGRLRQGIQYSYIRRDLWSGNGGTTNPGGGAHGDDNLIYTSLRYYLP